MKLSPKDRILLKHEQESRIIIKHAGHVLLNLSLADLRLHQAAFMILPIMGDMYITITPDTIPYKLPELVE